MVMDAEDGEIRSEIRLTYHGANGALRAGPVTLHEDLAERCARIGEKRVGRSRRHRLGGGRAKRCAGIRRDCIAIRGAKMGVGLARIKPVTAIAQRLADTESIVEFV